MTKVFYDPKGPEMRFEGHAGAGERGKDPVCAALSMLMYTLLEALPAGDAERYLADGYCRVCGGSAEPYEVIAAGLRLLAAEYPTHVCLEVRR